MFKIVVFEKYYYCEIDEVDVILENTFFKICTVNVRRKPVRFAVCRDGKEVNLKLTMILMAGGRNLNLVSMDKMNKWWSWFELNNSMELVGRLGMMGLPQSTFVRCGRGTRMYSPIFCHKSHHQLKK